MKVKKTRRLKHPLPHHHVRSGVVMGGGQFTIGWATVTEKRRNSPGVDTATPDAGPLGGNFGNVKMLLMSPLSRHVAPHTGRFEPRRSRTTTAFALNCTSAYSGNAVHQPRSCC
jgi:hypothetical protein